VACEFVADVLELRPPSVYRFEQFAPDAGRGLDLAGCPAPQDTIPYPEYAEHL
jgi:hypothetical protein